MTLEEIVSAKDLKAAAPPANTGEGSIPKDDSASSEVATAPEAALEAPAAAAPEPEPEPAAVEEPVPVDMNAIE